MTGRNSLPSLMTISKWVAIAADVKKLASHGVIGRTLNYINDAGSIAGHAQAISWSIESFKASVRSCSPCPD